ncbi:MAG: hypothetical protein NVSMB51_22000 [Solirubrobacteraceae bacterium]
MTAPRRRALLAGTCLVATTLARPAHAIFGIGDTTFCINCTTEYTEIMREAARGAQVLRQIQEATNTVSQLRSTYNAVTGIRDLGSAASALGLLGIQNPFPVNPYTMQSLISGQGGVQGVLSNLTAISSSTFQANALYLPSTRSWLDTQALTMARGTAAEQGVAMQGYRASADRLTQYAGLRTRAAAASDPKTVSDLQLSVQIANGEQAAQAQQLFAASMTATAQRDIAAQRTHQHERQCITQLIAYFNRTSDSQACPQGNAGGVSVETIAMTGGTGSVTVGTGNGAALEAMMAQPWGQQAAGAATNAGLNPATLAAMGQVESGLRNTSNGNAVGVWQMMAPTYASAMSAAGGSTDPAGRSNPATEAVAASTLLAREASTLQAAGIATPSGIDLRGGYNFGDAYTVPLARAADSDLMSNVLSSYSASTLASNGVAPGTTVGAWRQGLLSRSPDLAQPALLSNLRSS